MSIVTKSSVVKGKGLIETIVRTSGTNLMVMILGILTYVLTARMFGVAGQGEITSILFWSVFLSGLTGFGLPTSMIYNIKTGKGRAQDFVRTSFLFQIPVGIIVGFVSWNGLPIWLGSYPPEVVQAARLYTVFAVPILLAINLIAAIAQSVDKFKVYNRIRLQVPLFNLLGLLFLWGAGSLSVSAAAVVYYVTSLLVVIIALWGLRSELYFNWLKDGWNRGTASLLFGYGSRVFGVELLGTLYTQFDKLIILSMLTARDFGLYSVVYALSRVYNVVQNAITSVVFPKVTGQSKAVVASTVSRAFRLSLMLMLIIVVPSMLIGGWLISIVFGESFGEANGAFYMLSIECIVGGGSWILASSFNAMGKPGMVLLRQIVALFITVVLFFFLTPHYGLIGIALALLVGALIRMVISMIFMRTLFGVSLYSMLFDREDFRYLFKRLKEQRN